MKGSTVQKINNLTDNIGVVYSGLNPDSRVLVTKGRKLAQQYHRTYGESIPVSQIVKKIANVMQEYTQSGYFILLIIYYFIVYLLCYTIHRGVRPFGVSLLVAGLDENGPQLYQVDPSGSYWGWKASAIGKNMLNAKTFLEKRFVLSDK